MATGRIPNQYRVYDRGGIAPALNRMDGGGREPHIIEDFYKARDCRVFDIAPTLRSDRQGLKVIE